MISEGDFIYLPRYISISIYIQYILWDISPFSLLLYAHLICLKVFITPNLESKSDVLLFLFGQPHHSSPSAGTWHFLTPGNLLQRSIRLDSLANDNNLVLDQLTGTHPRHHPLSFWSQPFLWHDIQERHLLRRPHWLITDCPPPPIPEFPVCAAPYLDLPTYLPIASPWRLNIAQTIPRSDTPTSLPGSRPRSFPFDRSGEVRMPAPPKQRKIAIVGSRSVGMQLQATFFSPEAIYQ